VQTQFSGLDQKGKLLERSIMGLLFFVPRLVRTYVAIVARPRQYFQSLRDRRRSASLVDPASFWVANVVVVKALSALGTDGDRPWSLNSASDYAGLLLGLVVYPCFLVGILGIRGWQNLRRMMRIVFSCSVLFLPLHALSRIPFLEDTINEYFSSAFLGTPTVVSWYHVVTILLTLGAFLAWFLLLGFGIRQVFRRTRTSIGLSIVAMVSVKVTLVGAFFVLFLFPYGLKQLRRTAQLFGPARTALIHTPPDYGRAAESFRYMYVGSAPQLNRRYRLGARIGCVAAELAQSAVMFRQPTVEKKLYDCQMRVLAEDNEGAAAVLFEATGGLKSSKDPFAKMMITRKCEGQLHAIRKMLSDASYDPDAKRSSASAKNRFSIPIPTPFP
jgi:hypothetical protein